MLLFSNVNCSYLYSIGLPKFNTLNLTNQIVEILNEKQHIQIYVCNACRHVVLVLLCCCAVVFSCIHLNCMYSISYWLWMIVLVNEFKQQINQSCIPHSRLIMNNWLNAICELFVTDICYNVHSYNIDWSKTVISLLQIRKFHQFNGKCDQCYDLLVCDVLHSQRKPIK